MTDRRRTQPRRTARGGLPVQGHVPPRRPPEPLAGRRGPVIALALVVILLTAGLAARRIVASGYFRVERVQVSGAALVPEDVIRRAAGVEGEQLWQIDDGAVRAAVEGVAGVRHARVQRGWPDRLTVTVEERLPAVLWRAPGREAVVDEDGLVLDAPPMGGLPTVNQVDAAPGLAPGGRVDRDAVRLALRLGGLLPTEVGQRLSRIEYSSGGGLDAITDRGLRVRFGDAQNLEYKLTLWREINTQLKRENTAAREIDLRFGRWAALR